MLVTDLAYPAQGRRYGDEDVLLASRLRTAFDLVLCPPLDAARLVRGLTGFDGVVVRNSGPVLHYPAEYADLLAAVRERGLALYNPPTGRGDMQGKGYLLELVAAGLPVIPTVDRLADLDRLPSVAEYVVKPVAGADSIGLRFVPAAALADVDDVAVLVQPRIAFRYEVSFVFVDHDFQYAVSAPDPHARWRLEPYPTTVADLSFAQQFVDWNSLDQGIQRVDACRTTDGELLLVELEDLNPYLSLEVLTVVQLDRFVSRVVSSVRSVLT